MATPPPPPPPPPLPPSFYDRKSKSGSYGQNSSKQSQLQELGASPLVDAIKVSDAPLICKLLEHGENVNQLTMYGTPLSVAVRSNNLELVQLLLSQPTCDVNCRDYDGESALCLSLRKNCLPEISVYLISKGAAINCVDSVTRISLLATAVDHRQQQVVEAMLAAGCDVNLRDGNCMTPLTHACLLPEPKDIDDEGVDTGNYLVIKRQMITLLYKAGADVNSRLGPPFNGYLLHKLVLERSYFSLSALLELDKQQPVPPASTLDINMVNAIEGNTPLHLAVATGNYDIVKLLVEHGANLNLSNVFCDSPLSKALKDRLYDQSAVIRLLVSSGADVNFEDTTSTSRRKGHCRPIFAAIDNGDKATVDLLLNHGAKLSLCDYEGYCPIMPCLANGLSISLLHYIVDKMDAEGINYDISSYNYLRAAFRWTKHLQYLIDRGLNVNAIGPDGHQIIHTNYVKLYPSSLQVMLDNGLDPDALSGTGDTMLCACAGLEGYWPVVQLLIQYGADVNRVSMEDEEEERLTPVQKAFVREYDEDRSDNSSFISQFRYFINCGAVLSQHISLWRESFVANRIAVETSEDDSDSDSSAGAPTNNDADAKLSAYRSCLLSDLEAVFSPLTLSMICRNVIRCRLKECNDQGRIMECIQSLHIPPSTKCFISYIDVPTTYLLR